MSARAWDSRSTETMSGCVCGHPLHPDNACPEETAPAGNVGPCGCRKYRARGPTPLSTGMFLAEVSRAILGSGHGRAEELIRELELRVKGDLVLCGWRQSPTGDSPRFCLERRPHEGPHRGVLSTASFRPGFNSGAALDTHACCEGSPVMSWED